MLSSLFSVWVKNVYSLRIAGGISGVQMYTPSALSVVSTVVLVQNPTVMLRVVPVLYALLSTAKKAVFNLLTGRLYPQSTGPIINPNKEK
jgi:hypothetical protein